MTYDAVNELINQGLRDISIVLPFSRNISSVNTRYRAYVDAHIQNNIPIKKEYVRDNYIIEENKNFVDAVTTPPLKKNVDALFEEYYAYFTEYPEIEAVITINGMCFLAIIRAVERIKNETGRTIKVTVYDNDYDIVSSISTVPYNSLVQNGYEIGKIASQQIYNLLTGQNIVKKSLL